MLVRNRIVRNAEGAPGGGAPPGPTGPSPSPAPAPAPAPGPAPAPAPAPGPSGAQRPEFVPEKFWDPSKGEVRLQDAFKSLSEVESKVGKHKDQVKAEVLKELRQGVPEKPEGYEFKIPEGVVPEGLEIRVDEKANEGMITWWRGIAHKYGLKQEDFEAGVGEYLKGQVLLMPKGAEEKAKLGERADDRIKRVDAYLAKRLDKKHYDNLVKFSVYGDFVEAIEALMDAAGEPGLADVETAGTDTMTLEKLRQMQSDPRYHDPMKRDPEFVKKVEAGYRQLYPGKRRAG